MEIQHLTIYAHQLIPCVHTGAKINQPMTAISPVISSYPHNQLYNLQLSLTHTARVLQRGVTKSWSCDSDRNKQRKTDLGMKTAADQVTNLAQTI